MPDSRNLLLIAYLLLGVPLMACSSTARSAVFRLEELAVSGEGGEASAMVVVFRASRG